MYNNAIERGFLNLCFFTGRYFYMENGLEE